MGIKKLASHNNSEIKFKIGTESGLVLIENSSQALECLYIQSEEEEVLRKLEKIENVAKVKFLGSKNILKNIKDIKLPWPRFEKELIVNSDIEVIYHSQTGKVKILKEDFEREAIQSVPVKRRVLIIDDSKTLQKLLSKIIEPSEFLEVVAVADRPSQAREILEKQEVDLITLDIHMPEMNGVDFFKSYIKQLEIPTVMISSVSITEGPLVMEALSSGAVTYIQKPSANKLKEMAPKILEKLELVSKKKKVLKDKSVLKLAGQFKHKEGVILIGSSTGGTQAIEQILTNLPNQIPPIAIVQHIPAVFSKAFADRLNSLTPFLVKEAEEGEFLKENTVYIAPGGKQMKLLQRGAELKVNITDDPPVNRFKPSVDYLFFSVEKMRTKNWVGAILTGMGSDGAQGLLSLRKQGVYTIAQDEESSVVFGMPKRAIELDAVEGVASLSDMAHELTTAFNNLKN